MADIVFNSREEANAVIDYVDGWLPKADEEVAEASKKNRKAWLYYLLGFVIFFVPSTLLALLISWIGNVTGADMEKGSFLNGLLTTIIAACIIGGYLVWYVSVIKLVGTKGLSALWPNKESALGRGFAGAVGAGVGALAGVLSGVGGFGGLGATVIGIFWKPLAFSFKLMFCAIIPPLFVTAVKSRAKYNRKVMIQAKAAAEKAITRFPAV